MTPDELFNAVVFGAVASVLGAVFRDALAFVWWGLVYTCCHVRAVHSGPNAVSLRNYVSRVAIRPARSIGVDLLPVACGWFVCWDRGPMVIQIARGGENVPPSMVFALRAATVRAVVQAVTGMERFAPGTPVTEVPAVLCFALTGGREYSVSPRSATGPPSLTQAFWVETLLAEYRKKGNASILVWGPPGTGKSSLGLYLALALRSARATEGAYLVPSRDLLNSIPPFRFLSPPSESAPVVVVVNEFEAAIANADTPKALDKEMRCPAANRGRLLNTLDGWAAMKHFVYIATTNVDPNTFPPAYTRDGRFDFIIKFENPVTERAAECEAVYAAAQVVADEARRQKTAEALQEKAAHTVAMRKAEKAAEKAAATDVGGAADAGGEANAGGEADAGGDGDAPAKSAETKKME
jgi:hypothetical protein